MNTRGFQDISLHGPESTRLGDISYTTRVSPHHFINYESIWVYLPGTRKICHFWQSHCLSALLQHLWQRKVGIYPIQDSFKSAVRYPSDSTFCVVVLLSLDL